MALEQPGTDADGVASARDRRGHRRRLPPIIPLLVFLALAGGLVLVVIARSSPQQQIRRLIDRQIKLAVAGRFGLLHATLTPRAKAACGGPRDFAGELLGLRLSEPDFWHLVDIRDIDVQVNGDRALVTYTVTYNGRVVERATLRDPDVYIRWTAPTRLGPKPSKASVDAQLAALDRQQRPGPLANPLPPKQYRAARDRIIRESQRQPVLWERGQWYDELDDHIHC